MRIAVDAMGSDFGPEVLVQGALGGAKEYGCEIVLVGDKAILERELASQRLCGLDVKLHHASETVEMEESPTVALRRKKDSSIRACFELVKKGDADAVVTAGHSGAAMAAAIMVLKRIEGVERPALALLLPNIGGGRTVFLDVGSNVDCKAPHLAQFAVMGSVYAQIMLRVREPSVALLSNGEEESKGDEVTREAHLLLKKAGIKYVGYVEGRDIYSGRVDVIVCDGFVGNVVLKCSEGLVDAMAALLDEEIRKEGIFLPSGDSPLAGPLQKFRKKFDCNEYGGAPLLGINGVAVISHGGAASMAIQNAIGLACRFVAEKVNEHLAQALARNKDLISLASARSGRLG